jgi:hypothetical protein
MSVTGFDLVREHAIFSNLKPYRASANKKNTSVPRPSKKVNDPLPVNVFMDGKFHEYGSPWEAAADLSFELRTAQMEMLKRSGQANLMRSLGVVLWLKGHPIPDVVGTFAYAK